MLITMQSIAQPAIHLMQMAGRESSRGRKVFRKELVEIPGANPGRISLLILTFFHLNPTEDMHR